MLERIEEALQDIDKTGHVPEWIRDEPSAFLGDWCDAWVAAGGKAAGKNLRSISNMDAWLKDDNHNIRSLAQKLRGDVRLKRNDIEALITLFLRRGRAEKTDNNSTGSDLEHHPFEVKDLDRLVKLLVDAMLSTQGKNRSNGIQLRRSRRERASASERITSADIQKEMFSNSDALVVFSRHRSVANESVTTQAMEVFWNILNGFVEIIDDQDPNKILIWIVDLGSRQVEDGNAWRDFINVQLLKAQFEAFAHFDSSSNASVRSHQDGEYEPLDAFEREIERKIRMPAKEHRVKRWKKLSRRAVFVVEHLRDEESSRLFSKEYEEDKRDPVKEIGVSAEHILPQVWPETWHKLTKLYPDQIKDVSDASFVATIRFSDNETVEQLDKPNIAYYAYIPVLKGPVRGRVAQIRLDPPGKAYDQGFGLVYSAARYRLCERFRHSKKRKGGGSTSVHYLRKIGFEVLTILDLFSLFSTEPDNSEPTDCEKDC